MEVIEITVIFQNSFASFSVNLGGGTQQSQSFGTFPGTEEFMQGGSSTDNLLNRPTADLGDQTYKNQIENYCQY